MAAALDELTRSLRNKLVHAQVGGIEVVDAEVSESVNPDAESGTLVVRLKISGPGSGDEWTPADASELRSRVRDALAGLALPGAEVVLLVPDTPDYGED